MPRTLEKHAEIVMQLAEARCMTVATVESCTAGSFAHLLSRVEGASKTLHGGFIVYTKQNKVAAVGVPAEVLEAHTAVSAAVAEAMAAGGLARCPASVVAAITGVAGPEPDEDGNPVGLVYVAAAIRDGPARVVQHDFGKLDRDRICNAAIGAALTLLAELLQARVP